MPTRPIGTTTLDLRLLTDPAVAALSRAGSPRTPLRRTSTSRRRSLPPHPSSVSAKAPHGAGGSIRRSRKRACPRRLPARSCNCCWCRRFDPTGYSRRWIRLFAHNWASNRSLRRPFHCRAFATRLMRRHRCCSSSRPVRIRARSWRNTRRRRGWPYHQLAMGQGRHEAVGC